MAVEEWEWDVEAAEAAPEVDSKCKTKMVVAEVDISNKIQEAVVSLIIREEATHNRLEATLTRWEIAHKEDSNHRTSHHLPEEVLQITKLSCVDTSNFVSKLYFINLPPDGNCKYENKCSYAHGEAELRQYKSGNGGGMGSPQKMGGNMPPQPQGMPSPMSMDMNMNNQFGNMMMPSQMGFPNQGMYIDPMQMLMNNSQFDGQQFPPSMMGNNQFMNQMQSQQPFNNMMQMPPPISLKFTQVQNMQDGSCQNVDSQLTIQQMDQAYEVTQRIKQAVDFISNNALNDGFSELIKLMNEKKLTYSCMPLQ